MRKWKILAFGAIFALTSSVSFFTPTNEAKAQSACSPRSDVVGHLAKKYGEIPVALGVTNKGGLVEVLTTGDGGTWTIILSKPNGTSCLVAAGEGWHMKAFDAEKLQLDPEA